MTQRALRGRDLLHAWPFLVIGSAVLIALIGPLVAPHDPNQSDLSRAFAPPSAEHWLGFDGQGRDLMSRLLVGAGTSLLGPLAVTVLSMLLGATIALIASWRGGWIDSTVASTLELMFSFPGILLALLVAALFGAGLWTAVGALSVAYLPYAARVIRSAAIVERRKAYIEACEAQGSSGLSICVRHLIPNLAPILAAQSALLFSYAMVDLAVISYFGLGVQFPNADWGGMVATGQAGVLQGYPAESLMAGACIVALVIAFNALAERLGTGGRTPLQRVGLVRRIQQPAVNA